MKSLRAVGAALTVLSLAAISPAFADGGNPFELGLRGGVQAINKNDTALPDQFLGVPAAAAIAYHFNPTWAVEGELSWQIPVKTSVDLGSGITADRKTPDAVFYQANVILNLPVNAAKWTPYVTAGAGAVTFLSNTDADTYPQLPKSETALAVNAGAGTSYAFSRQVAVKVEFREFGAFPSDHAAGFANNGKADPIWMERGTLGLGFRF